jgi:hypothetical protein
MLRRKFSNRFFGNEQEWDYRTPVPDRFRTRRLARPLEGAGRAGWDTEQNRGYGDIFGNQAGPSTFVQGGELNHSYGKGPRNYRRSDERIMEDISECFTHDRFLDASEIEIEVKDGEVILSGHVNDRASKRRAEDLAEIIAGVKHLENRLKFAH